MFTFQNWKVKLAYAGFGCLFGSLCTIMGMLASPVTAQRDKFGEIECTKLTVLGFDGTLGLVLGVGEHGGIVNTYSNDGKSGVRISIDEYGGVVGVISNKKTKVSLHADEHRGSVNVYDKGMRYGGILSVDKYGGFFMLDGKGEGKVAIGINEYGNGVVSTWDKNGYRQ